MMNLLKSIPSKEDNQYFKHETRRINPIKNFSILVNQKNIELERVKRNRRRVWKFETDPDGWKSRKAKAVYKKIKAVGLESQRKLQKLSTERFRKMGAQRALSNNISLRDLEFSTYHLSDLKKSFRKMKSLHRIAVRIGCQLEMNQLKKAFKTLRSVRNLSLDFINCLNLRDEELKDILKPFVALERLSMNFSGHHKITDDGIQYLKESFDTLNSVQHFSLNLSGCFEITDIGMNHLTESLRAFNSLQTLSMNFQRCGEISDAGVNQLKENLGALNSLQNLSLHFGE